MPHSERIHIIGHGNIGRLFAHALSTSPSPSPITLLFHRPDIHNEWEKAEHRIEIKGISKFLPDIPSSSSTYETELIDPGETNLPKIKNLIIATKTDNTIAALNSIANRLTPETTLLFAQNGMGVTSKVEEQIIGKLGPQYLSGYKANCLGAIITHGLYSTSPFHSTLAGYGSILIGPHYASPFPSPSPSQSKCLLSALTSAPLLNAHSQPHNEFLLSIDKKLVVNSTINPLSVIFQRKNGNLFNHAPIYELMRILVSEMYSTLSHKLESDGVKDELPRRNLESVVLSVAEKTAENTSSMLQDYQAGRETEIKYLNGWFVDQGRGELRCNRILVDLVKERRTIEEDQICEVFGLEWCLDDESGDRVLVRKKSLSEDV